MVEPEILLPLPEEARSFSTFYIGLYYGMGESLICHQKHCGRIGKEHWLLTQEGRGFKARPSQTNDFYLLLPSLELVIITKRLPREYFETIFAYMAAHSMNAMMLERFEFTAQ